MSSLVEELEVLEGDVEFHCLCLAGSKGNLLESLQLLYRTVNRTLVIANIKLYNLLALTLANIAHRY